MPNYQSLCSDVIEVTKAAAQFISKEKLNFHSSDIQYKSKHDLVSYVDIETEKMLIDQLKKLVPPAHIIGEETEKDFEKKGFTWIIDPLDGTTNFIHGIPFFCISIALYENDKPLIGVIHEINQDEIFYAFEGSDQAFLNGKPIAVTDNKDFSNAFFATGFPVRDSSDLHGYVNVMNDVILKTRGIRRLGSAAADLAYVACGRFDAFYELNLSPWDVAAGAFIVEKAGGTVTDFDGGSNFVFGREILAGKAEVCQEFLNILKKHLK